MSALLTMTPAPKTRPLFRGGSDASSPFFSFVPMVGMRAPTELMGFSLSFRKSLLPRKKYSVPTPYALATK